MARVLIVLAMLIVISPSWASDLIVTDGDTLIADGALYRLDGIDAPATDQTCLDEHGAIWRCGIEARDELKEYIGVHGVGCEDIGPDPVYRKRRIGNCRVEGEGINLSQWLVREGWALPIDRNGRFKTDQDHARDNRKGLWKGCFVSPQALRRLSRSTAKLLGENCLDRNEWELRSILFPNNPTMPPGCSIKGMLTVRTHVFGRRGIYHLVACRSYGRIKEPDRWFCSEDEARAEGFRKAHMCGKI